MTANFITVEIVVVGVTAAVVAVLDTADVLVATAVVASDLAGIDTRVVVVRILMLITTISIQIR